MRNDTGLPVKNESFPRFADRQELLINERMTVKTALAKYERERLPNFRTGKRIARILERLLLPLEANTAIASFTRQDIRQILEPFRRRGQNGLHNQFRAMLSAFFKWCVRQDFAYANPVEASEEMERITRDVVLEDEQLAAIWKASTKIRHGNFVQFLMLSGQRSGEIAKLQWKWIDLRRGLVTMPKEEYKTGKAHTYPLSPLALEIVKAARKFDCDGNQRKLPYVFGTGRARIQYKSYIKEAIDDHTGDIGDWRFHDFRRSCRTRLEDYGCDRYESERLLGHVLGGVEGTYNRSSFTFQKVRAVTLWEIYLTARVIPVDAKVKREAEAKLKAIEERMKSI